MIYAEIKSKQVITMHQTPIIYTSAACPVCHMAKDLLDSLDIEYKERNVDINPLALGQLIVSTGKFTVPQTVINGQRISGFNPEQVVRALHI